MKILLVDSIFDEYILAFEVGCEKKAECCEFLLVTFEIPNKQLSGMK